MANSSTCTTPTATRIQIAVRQSSPRTPSSSELKMQPGAQSAQPARQDPHRPLQRGAHRRRKPRPRNAAETGVNRRLPGPQRRLGQPQHPDGTRAGSHAESPPATRESAPSGRAGRRDRRRGSPAETETVNSRPRRRCRSRQARSCSAPTFFQRRFDEPEDVAVQIQQRRSRKRQTEHLASE